MRFYSLCIAICAFSVTTVSMADESVRTDSLTLPTIENIAPGFTVPLAALTKPAKFITDFTGIYSAPFYMVGRPKPIINRSGNIRVTCTAPSSFATQFSIQQSGAKLFAYTGLGNLKGKVKGRTFNANGGSSSQRVNLKGKEITPTQRSLGLVIKNKLAAGIYCQYRYSAMVERLY